MQFSDLPLHTNLLKALTESKHHTPTPVQQEVIPIALTKKDVVATAQTGTGKTAAFLLPIIHKLGYKPLNKPRVIIFAPTKE